MLDTDRHTDLGYGPNVVFIPRVPDPANPHDTTRLEVPDENLAWQDPRLVRSGPGN